jgi:hypothetical protein
MFRLAAKLGKEMRAAGFTDNGGAIHSAERILNILGLCLVYPDLSHINNLRKYGKAEFSVKARAAYDRGLLEQNRPFRDTATPSEIVCLPWSGFDARSIRRF